MQWFSPRGSFVPLPLETFGNVQSHFWLLHLERGGGGYCRLSSEWEPGMQRTAPRQRIIWPQMSRVLMWGESLLWPHRLGSTPHDEQLLSTCPKSVNSKTSSTQAHLWWAWVTDKQTNKRKWVNSVLTPLLRPGDLLVAWVTQCLKLDVTVYERSLN